MVSAAGDNHHIMFTLQQLISCKTEK